MNIRPASSEDRNAWATMRAGLWPDTDDSHTGEIDDYFAGSSVDIVQCYVADQGSRLTGFIELNVRNYAEGSHNSQVPYVEGWYVDPAYRGNGCGKTLLEKAAEWARSLGFEELASDAELSNEQSIAMHKHLGFREVDRVVCFLKKL